MYKQSFPKKVLVLYVVSGPSAENLPTTSNLMLYFVSGPNWHMITGT